LWGEHAVVLDDGVSGMGSHARAKAGR
jgi:hypothetical protein